MKLIVTCLILPLVLCLPVYGARRARKTHFRSPHRVQYGLASWYGEREQGRPMACGEPFNEYAMVAAHRTLPLGTTVRVTNLRNGRSVVVRIMDRGPSIADRAIDLSKAAAERLRFVNQGLTPVRISVLNLPGKHTREAEATRHSGRNYYEFASTADRPSRRAISC
jgi:rare lipoprotein A